MTLEELEQLADPNGFQPFAIVTQGGLRMEIPHSECLDIPPEARLLRYGLYDGSGARDALRST